MIIFRYLSKEILSYFLILTIVLLLIFVSNTAIRLLSSAAEGSLASTALIYLIFLQLPFLLGMILPVCFFFGVVLAYGRLYMNNEMTALFAAGMSRAYLVKTALFFGVIVALMTAAVMTWVSPSAEAQVNSVASNQVFSSLLNILKPGEFQDVKGRATIFVKSISPDRKTVKEVFVAQPPNQSHPEQGWMLLSAADGEKRVTDSGDVYAVAKNGFQYQGTPGNLEMKMVKFDEFGVRVDIPKSVSLHSDISTTATAELLRRIRSHHDTAALAELEWRLSMPLTALILSLFAVPFSSANPRRGKFTYLIPSLFVVAAYMNMLFIVNTWVDNGTLPVKWGVWWVHAVMLLFALFCYFFQNRRVTYFLKRGLL